jgi:hypothetical protein
VNNNISAAVLRATIAVEPVVDLFATDDSGVQKRIATKGRPYAVFWPQPDKLSLSFVGDTGVRHEISGEYFENFRLIDRGQAGERPGA